jgi:hypothetical protein
VLAAAFARIEADNNCSLRCTRATSRSICNSLSRPALLQFARRASPLSTAGRKPQEQRGTRPNFLPVALEAAIQNGTPRFPLAFEWAGFPGVAGGDPWPFWFTFSCC